MDTAVDTLEQWPQAQEANQIEMLAYLGTSPISRSCLSDNLSWVITGVYDNTWNGVVCTRLPDEMADDAICDVLDRFRSCIVPIPAGWYPESEPAPDAGPAPFQWYLPEGSLPADAAARLEAHGCRRLGPGRGMGMDLAALPASGDFHPGLEVRAVRDAGTLAAWCAVLDEDAYQKRLRTEIHGSLGLGWDEPYQRFLAELNGDPVGAASVFLGENAAGVYDVKVHSEFWRRGIGTAVTLAALRHARDRDFRAAVLSPSPEGAGMYARLGFSVYSNNTVSFV